MLLIKGLYLPSLGERLHAEEIVPHSVTHSEKGLGTTQVQDKGDLSSGDQGWLPGGGV